MASRADLVPLRIDDPNCRGVTSSNGRVRYDKDATGRVHVPRAEAQRLMQSGYADIHSGAPRTGMGMNPRPEFQAAYEAFCAQRGPDDPFVPYARWYRLYREEEQACNT